MDWWERGSWLQSRGAVMLVQEAEDREEGSEEQEKTVQKEH